MNTNSALLKLALSGFFILSASSVMAYEGSCIKPTVSGVSKDEMSCLSKNLVLIYGEDGSMVLNNQGKTIIPKNRYTYIFQESEGLIAVANERGGDFAAGYVDSKTGKEVIPVKYLSTGHNDIGINSFSEGLVALLNQDQKYGFVNTKGKTVIPFKYASAESFSEGLAVVSKAEYDGEYILPGNYGFIDKTGKVVVPFNYDYANSFSEGLATVRKNDKWGAINKQGKVVVPLKFEGVLGDFSNGLASVVRNDNTHGFINTKGQLVIPYKYISYSYGSLPQFHNGKAHVTDAQGNSYCINTKDKKVACD